MIDLESAVITANTQLWKPEHYPFEKSVVQQRLAAGELLRIFGPCSLHSTEQILAMLQVIAPHTDLVRAPGKKPRTRPFDAKGKLLFEGIGMVEAGRIMAEAVQHYPQVVFASELMAKGDIGPVLPFLQLGWVGSRTQSQEVIRDLGADSLQAEIPLMVKNPLTDNLELLVGMLENAILGGNFTVPVLLCLRGTEPTTAEEKAKWRNVPNYHLIPELKKIFPDLPIIVDVGHQLKKADLTPQKVAELAQQGVDNGADGYIAELHTPEHPSLTDPGSNAIETLEEFDKRGLL